MKVDFLKQRAEEFLENAGDLLEKKDIHWQFLI